MSRRNYDQMYNNSNYEKKKIPVVETVEEIVEPVVEEKVEPVANTVREKVEKEETPEVKKSYTGRVIGGLKLNVRKEPNGDVISTLSDGDVVTIIDDTESEWYKIKSPEGFVMKKFVQV